MPPAAVPAMRRIKVLSRLPHPARGFTQGLIATGGTVWESTGQYGKSALRRYRLGAEREDECAPVPPQYFAEGICWADGHIWQLTWQERVALRWQADPLTLVGIVPYNREGWGICATGDFVMTSDGSSELVRRDRVTLTPLEVVVVHCAGHRITGLNDLAWSGGLVWANVLSRPVLAGIDPGSGEVVVHCAGQRITGLNDLAWSGGLVWANVLGRPVLAGIDPGSGEVIEIADARKADERHWGDPQAVMNGIAAMPGAGEFLLTGKGWRHSYHVRLTPSRSHRDPVRLLTG